jgi:hypothetical protein
MRPTPLLPGRHLLHLECIGYEIDDQVGVHVPEHERVVHDAIFDVSGQGRENVQQARGHLLGRATGVRLVYDREQAVRFGVLPVKVREHCLDVAAGERLGDERTEEARDLRGEDVPLARAGARLRMALAST